jgi:hypothetical protein
MGGCCSTDVIPDVPDTILADPGITDVLSISFQRIGSSHDFLVSNAVPFNDDKKWLFINKANNVNVEGFDSCIDIENFRRLNTTSEDKAIREKGEVLWRCAFARYPVINQQVVESWNRHNPWNRMEIFHSNTGSIFSPPQNGSGYYDSFDHSNRESIIARCRVLFSYVSNIILIPMKGRDQSYSRLQMQVYVCGCGIKTRKEVWKEVDGRRERHEETDEREIIDQIQYRVLTQSGDVIDQWMNNGDDPNNTKVTVWSSKCFQVTKTSKVFSKDSYEINTLPGTDPVLALLLGFLSAYQYSPDVIRSDVKLRYDF